MDINFNDISIQIVALYLAFAIAMYFVFGIIGKYIIPLIKNWKYSRNIQDLWMKFKIISSIIFLILFYHMLLNSNLIITLIFSVIVIGLGWNFWKNVLAGVLIKYTMIIRKGEIIETEKVKGEVQSIQVAYSNLLNDKGEIVVVPNYFLRASIVKHLNEGTSIRTHTFDVKVNGPVNSEELLNHVLNCPYISSNQKINIRRKDVNCYVITAIMIDASFVELTEKYFQTINVKS